MLLLDTKLTELEFRNFVLEHQGNNKGVDFRRHSLNKKGHVQIEIRKHTTQALFELGMRIGDFLVHEQKDWKE